jgi:hypothetical protein
MLPYCTKVLYLMLRDLSSENLLKPEIRCTQDKQADDAYMSHSDSSVDLFELCDG